ncbi:hypothetical protein PU629_08330 [Pullulanibacillus sp. KACC 23026]|uniref:hypothetical protein n=1 Tax=Pullulanibacillus sp. KACC 23026 TaxID=3028315 RepID=UPI0023AEE7BC|nr:hypothetical protein [Pullulanibacillus sp. KACC 23026]WEG14354.1 hypothetical protein PU629_08330 [Pullulanibacillus sp. KACC 23026]
MNINWEDFRLEELKSWRLEIEEEMKQLEKEMIKQQKLREKYLLRYYIAKQVESDLEADSKLVLPYLKKKEQADQEARDKLKILLEQHKVLKTFKQAITQNLNNIGEINIETKEEHPIPTLSKKKKIKKPLPQRT